MDEEYTKEKKKKQNYEIDMCNGPLAGKMLMFAIPYAVQYIAAIV